MSFNNSSDKNLSEFRKHSGRSVIVCEADMREDDIRFVYHYSNNLRKIHNQLIRYVNANLDTYFNSDEYASLSKAYSELDKRDTETKRELGLRFTGLQESCGLTQDNIRRKSILLRRGFPNISAVSVVSVYEDVYSALKDILYAKTPTTKVARKHRRLHYVGKNDIQSIRVKQYDRDIIIKEHNGNLLFSFKRLKFGVKSPSNYILTELERVADFLKNSSDIEKIAVSKFLENGEIVNTHRPCYCTLVCKTIRRKKHVYIHITIEGKPFDKLYPDGTPKHVPKAGRVGIDVGTQSIAVTSNTIVGMYNLDGRGLSAKEYDKKVAKIQQKMDNSLRVTNKECFNANGTYKHGVKITARSNRYKKQYARLLQIYRKHSINVKLHHNELVNSIVKLGDEFIIEPSNASELMLKKEYKPGEDKDERGQFKSKRGHGWGVGHFCGGYFVSHLKQVVENYGGQYIEVNKYHYRASQYNHFTDEYQKKPLDIRMCCIGKNSDGNDVVVQRDMYSSFCLANYSTKMKISRELCELNFWKWYELYNQFVKFIGINMFHINNADFYGHITDI